MRPGGRDNGREALLSVKRLIEPHASVDNVSVPGAGTAPLLFPINLGIYLTTRSHLGTCLHPLFLKWMRGWSPGRLLPGKRRSLAPDPCNGQAFSPVMLSSKPMMMKQMRDSSIVVTGGGDACYH